MKTAVSRIEKIEELTVDDPDSFTGKSYAGFRTYYTHSRYRYAEVRYSNRKQVLFLGQDGAVHEIELDACIEPLDIYHMQYGIAVADAHDCFFISSWLKGIYCCDLKTGRVKWNYRLKHGNEVVVYPDFILCVFQEIGLRKLNYAGEEIAKYPITTYNAFDPLEDPYVFIGPNRGAYLIVDVSTMRLARRIKQSSFAKPDDHLIILKTHGTVNEIQISGFKNEERFEQTIHVDQPKEETP